MSSVLDVAYTYGTGVTTVGCYVYLRTSDRRRKRDKLVPAPYLATMDWSSAALETANGRIEPLTDIG